jgi:hypothetical protein
MRWYLFLKHPPSLGPERHLANGNFDNQLTVVVLSTPLPPKDPLDPKVQRSMSGMTSEMGLDFMTDPLLRRQMDHGRG